MRREMLTAIHEAGHAAIWLAAGHRVRSIQVDGGWGQVRPAAVWVKDARLPAAGALAGPIAEARASGRTIGSVLASSACATDLREAKGYLDVSRIPPKFVNTVAADVRREWRLVMAIAEAVAEKGRLGASELNTLRRRHKSWF